MVRNSDVDLLITKEGVDADLRARSYEKLYGVRVAVDAILVSPSDVELYKDSHGLVIKPALQEGRVVYESTRAICAGWSRPDLLTQRRVRVTRKPR